MKCDEFMSDLKPRSFITLMKCILTSFFPLHHRNFPPHNKSADTPLLGTFGSLSSLAQKA